MYVDPNRNTEAGNLKWILPYCKPDLPRVAGAIVLFCVNNTMALIIPLLSGLIVDRVIVQGQVDELTRLCIMMIVFTIVRVASRYGYQMWMERFGQNSVFRLVSDEYEKLHELDFTYFNHTRTGDIMSRMTSDTDAIRHALSWVSYQVLDCVVMFIGALAMMFTIDWRPPPPPPRAARDRHASRRSFSSLRADSPRTQDHCSSPSATRLPK